MPSRLLATLPDYFAELEDPRIDRCKQHELSAMLTIAICAVICGADSYSDMEQFGKAKQEWFGTFLNLPNGIPSHDTFSRVLSVLDPEALSACFASWVEAIATVSQGEIIAVDGKTLRRSFDQASGKGPIHMVSAWATTNGLSLGQVKTSEKSNEITAIPKLLELLSLEGTIVTIDAMGCQKDIAKKIIDQRADYVLALKGNQGTLHDDVKLYLDDALKHGFGRVPCACATTVDGDHGRIERRRIWCCGEIAWLATCHVWPGLQSIGVVESEVTNKRSGKTHTERRYFISSLDGRDAELFGKAVRRHWEIENGLHWILDVAFREDESRVRIGNGAENCALLRRMALSLLKREATLKRGVKGKRLAAGWNNTYLLNVLGIRS